MLHSFHSAGVHIEEPIAESTLFRAFADREEAAGRIVHADRSWITATSAPASNPHRITIATRAN